MLPLCIHTFLLLLIIAIRLASIFSFFYSSFNFTSRWIKGSLNYILDSKMWKRKQLSINRQIHAECFSSSEWLNFIWMCIEKLFCSFILLFKLNLHVVCFYCNQSCLQLKCLCNNCLVLIQITIFADVFITNYVIVLH